MIIEEKKYWQKVGESLRKNDGDHISINPNGEELTRDILDKTLWE